MSTSIRNVVLVGRDAPVWLTALGLQRALKGSGVQVRVVQLPTELRDVDFYATLPTHRIMHRLLGVKEDLVYRFAKATMSLGQRFAGFARTSPAFMHPYDTVGIALNNVDFINFWVKARSEGMNVAYEDFSVGTVAAKQGRISENTSQTALFSKASHGYHLDAYGYVQLLQAAAVKAGVEFVNAQLTRVDVAEGRIRSISLNDGQTLDADLFIDASGDSRALIGRLRKDNFLSWREWFACDRTMVMSGGRLSPLPSFAHVHAFRSGWVSMHPLQDRTGVKAAFNSAELSDDDMFRTIGALTNLRSEQDAVAAPLNPGVLATPWIGNCVAVGDTAIALEPLDALDLQVAHASLSHLISFFPVEEDMEAEAARYNAGIRAHAENMRDFQIVHYKLNRRNDEPLWDRARDMAVPESLAYKLDLFGATGRVAMYDDETFEEENWSSILIGHGLIPKHYHPFVDGVPAEEQIGQMQGMLRFIAEHVQDMSSQEAYLELQAPQTGSAPF